MNKLNPTKKSTNRRVTAKSSVTKKASEKKPKAKKAVAKNTATKKESASQSVVKAVRKQKAIENEKTAVIAKVNVGFGNELFIRGESGELSWEKGLPMSCKGSDEWHWESSTIEKPTAFKLLINDSAWSIGENETAIPSATCNTSPTF